MYKIDMNAKAADVKCLVRTRLFFLTTDQFPTLSVAVFQPDRNPVRPAVTLSDGSVPRAAVLVYWAPLGLERSC